MSRGRARHPKGLVEDGEGVARASSPRQEAQQVGDHTIEREHVEAVDLLDVFGDEPAVVCDEPPRLRTIAAVGYDDVDVG